MPSTVADVFTAAEVEHAGVVPWGDPVRAPGSGRVSTGVYAIALTEKLGSILGARDVAPISFDSVQRLLDARPECRLDGVPATVEHLARRLRTFWFCDEVVLYIGLAGPRKKSPPEGELAKRVGEYYGTPLGARSPHAGGWFLKTLANLGELHVHYGYCGDVVAAERAMLRRFAQRVSADSRAGLHDSQNVMPFANLEYPKGVRKSHGIKGAKAERRPGGAVNDSAADIGDSLKPTRARTPHAAGTGLTHHLRTQQVTPNDIGAGQVRIPRGATKASLPQDRQDITVRLRGRELSCRWDARYGPPERSGVIRIGRAAAREFLAPGDVLAVSVIGDAIHLD